MSFKNNNVNQICDAQKSLREYRKNKRKISHLYLPLHSKY